MDSNTMTRMRPTSTWTEGPCLQAPKGAVHGTGLSIAGTSEQVSGSFTTAVYADVLAGSAAFAGVRSTDLPGLPPRGAPV